MEVASKEAYCQAHGLPYREAEVCIGRWAACVEAHGLPYREAEVRQWG